MAPDPSVFEGCPRNPYANTYTNHNFLRPKIEISPTPVAMPEPEHDPWFRIFRPYALMRR